MDSPLLRVENRGRGSEQLLGCLWMEPSSRARSSRNMKWTGVVSLTRFGIVSSWGLLTTGLSPSSQQTKRRTLADGRLPLTEELFYKSPDLSSNEALYPATRKSRARDSHRAYSFIIESNRCQVPDILRMDKIYDLLCSGAL
jgi:hypothetical protein